MAVILATLVCAVLLDLLVAPAAMAQATVTKILYLHDDQTLTRTPQAGDTTTAVTVAGGGGFEDWVMTPAIPSGMSLVLAAGTVTGNLVIEPTGLNTANNRPLRVELRTGTGAVIGSQAFTFTSNAITSVPVSLPVVATTVPAGDYLVLRVYNDETKNDGVTPYPERTIDVSQQTALEGPSTISLATSTFVNVDSISAYSAPYPATTTQPLYDDGQTVYLRVVASDPFGSADISDASLTLTDAASAVVAGGVALGQVAMDAGTRTYEYAYLLQAGSATGSWTIDATASEGSEGTVTHSASGNFNVGVPQLAVTTSHAGNFLAGGAGNYSIAVHNNGPPLVGTTTVVDTLDASLAYVSGGGTGWSCGTAGQVVTCTNGTSLATGGDLPALSIAVAVAGSASDNVANFATVSHPSVNGGTGQDGNTDVATIVHPDLSASTKSVLDLNGGDADPGDTLRYTITLRAGAGADANGASVIDDIPPNVSGFTVVSSPAGSVDASTSIGGANGTGYLDISGIDVGASGEATIIFEVTVAAGAVPGDQISNTATINQPNGAGMTASAPTITVSQSQAAGAGNKVLYLDDTQGLTRTPQSADTVVPVDIAGAMASADWTMTPDIPAGKTLVLEPGNAVAQLVISTANNALTAIRPVTAELRTSTGSIATSGSVDVVNSAPGLYTFTIAVPSQVTLSPGDHLVLRVLNALPGNAGRHVAVYQRVSGVGSSKLTFATSTVVNVDSINVYSAPYPAVTTAPLYLQGDTVYVRAVVSDPFGSTDAGSADVRFTDVNGVVALGGAAMTQVADSGVATRTFEYAYTIPADAALGFWTASATGHEGTEGTVSHTANLAFGVGVSQLSVLMSHAGNFNAGGTATYDIIVRNNSPTDVTGTTTVTDTLDANLAYVSAGGTGGWSCSAAGQVVTCTNATTIVADSDLPSLTLVASVAGTAAATIDNAASVSNPAVNAGAAQAGNVDTAIILHPDLSNSTIDVVDLNGGDADPGDTLRYTINLIEQSGAPPSNVRVTDDIPANVTGFTVVGVPAGATDASTPGGGANGNGYLDVGGIAFSAGGTASIVFDATVAAAALPGDNIDNVATVANPLGPGATPGSRTVTVSQSQAAGAGNKLLYLHDEQSLTRTPQAANSAAPVDIAGGGSSYADWQMTPAVATGKSLVLTAGDINVNLVLAASNAGSTNTRPVTVELRTSSGSIATSAPVNVSGATTTTTNAYAFAITVPQTTLSAGDYLVLRILNGAGGANRHVSVYQKTAANGGSTVSLATSTVINVDSVAVFSGAYPAVTTQANYVHGEVAYIRAVISDPFGSADVDHATLTMTDPAGTVKVTSVPMTLRASDASTRTFGFAFVVPPGARLGSWTASVTGHEGTEGTVTHTANASFEVQGRISLGKTWLGANAGDAVSLAIIGGAGAVPGASTAPSTTTPASATSSAGVSITLSETYTSGSAGNYSPALACSKNSDGSALVPAGSGSNRTITMPIDSSVTCTWTNEKTVPVSIVKVSSVRSDPINGAANPKAIPGAIVEYSIILTNPGTHPIDDDSLFVRDSMPAQAAVRVADIGGPGSGPVSFTDGSPPSGLTYSFTSLASNSDDVEFSNDNGATWTYVPTPDAYGTDAAVTGIRIHPKGSFNTGSAQCTLKFRVRVK